MFFAPAFFPHMPYLKAHEDDANPITFAPRADQSACNFSDSATDISDLFSSLTCSDTALSDLLNSEASDVRTIDGSSRLFSSDNLAYLLPLDDEEFQRLDKQDFLLRLGMGAVFPLRQDIEDVIGKVGSAQGDKTVLDVGCGSGKWALAMASMYTHLRVVAIDQASQLPEDPPANVKWERHDVNQGLKPYHGQFDIVHVRCIGSGITSYRALLQEASKCLKPGGLAIFVEGDFDLLDEDQQKILEPATDGKPGGSYLQRWMQAVREAQIRRCGLSGSDDSPETLDKGLWQFDIYDPSSCNTASVFTPITPWPQSAIPEETLHFKVAGILMRQNLKLFVLATEQLLLEDGHLRAEINDWGSHIRDEIQGSGGFKWWYRWRMAWGRIPADSVPNSLQEQQSAIASSTIQPQVLPSERRQVARQQLMSKVPQFTWKQCHVRNKSESLAYAKQRDHEPFSTRGRF